MSFAFYFLLDCWFTSDYGINWHIVSDGENDWKFDFLLSTSISLTDSTFIIVGGWNATTWVYNPITSIRTFQINY